MDETQQARRKISPTALEAHDMPSPKYLTQVELSGRIGTVALHVTAGQHDQPTTVACRAGGTYHSARMKLSIITALFYSASGLSTPRREFAMFVFFGAVNTVLTYGFIYFWSCLSLTQLRIRYLTPLVFSFPTI